MKKAMLVSIGVLLLSCGAVLGAKKAKKEKTPYPLYPDLYKQVRAEIEEGQVQAPRKRSRRKRGAPAAAAVQNEGSPAMQAIDAALTEVAPNFKDSRQSARLMTLCRLREALQRFAPLEDKETALVLLDDPDYLGRFLNIVDDSDSLPGAMSVLKTLREYDEAKFKKHKDFCVAFSVVWDDFRGYHWVEKSCGPTPKDHMLGLYKFFFKHEKFMIFKPWELPAELAVYVVHSRVTPEERTWVMKNYQRKTMKASGVYSGVPWTEKLSPAHGKGGGIPYTMMNIKDLGGVCMEQAYFTEQVFRLHGVPAIYMRGEGARGGHAWAGVFKVRPKPNWDFSAGRYRFDRYYLGSCTDPTNPRTSQLEARIKMTAAVFGGRGTQLKMDNCYAYSNAAGWALQNYVPPEAPEESDAESKPKSKTKTVAPLTRTELAVKLLDKALKANPFKPSVWETLFSLAQKKELTSDEAMEWAKKLSEKTLHRFPDYTVFGMDSLFQCVDDNDLKIKLYKKMYAFFQKARADLASNVKISEGDIWLAKGDVKLAIQSYVYPMVNFSKDDHILSLAKKKLQSVGTGKSTDSKDVKKACKDILKVLSKGKKTPERTEAADIIRKKLNSIK